MNSIETAPANQPAAAAAGATPPGWARSRYGFAAFYLTSLLGAFLLLRVLLFVQFRPEATMSLGEGLRAFGIGLYRDLVVALVLTLPLLAWFLVLPERWFARRWHRGVFWAFFFVFWMVEVFLLAAEYYFFEEFRSRFNTVAVDYLLYPHEVFINIWDSYPVPLVVGGCALLSGAWLWAAMRLFSAMWSHVVSARSRLLHLAGALALCGALAASVSFKGPRFSRERTLNEIANNGALSFLAAFWTRHLDYAAFYKTLPREEAYARVRRLLTTPAAPLVDEASDSLRRRVAGDPRRPRLNVVILLEESLGSEFWGSLGRTKPTCTPEMDKLAAAEGLLFTQIYASGNRTVRGLESVLSSFPPLPGDSIVARDLSDHVETLARVLQRDGYRTIFVYGGRGVFDGMRSFALRNGYDRFIEQKHFANPTFATIWGVCDEDIMQRSLEEFRALAATGQPFFGTVLSVSNHKPYTYPPGRIPEDPARRRREHAVKYSDYALGRFFEGARREPFWTNTIFVVVADHGARVYGSQSVPIGSYEIPLLIVGPAVVPQASRVPHLGSALDVAPTILGLIGRPYETLFFGRDLLNSPPEEGRALLHHNRDIGLYARQRLVTLGLRHTVEFYAGDPKAGGLKRLAEPGPLEQELEKDAIALFQVADDLYIHRRYRLDP